MLISFALCFRLNQQCQQQYKSHDMAAAHTHTHTHIERLANKHHAHTYTMSQYTRNLPQNTCTYTYTIGYACSNTISHIDREMKSYIHTVKSISLRDLSLSLSICVNSVKSSVCVFTHYGLVCREGNDTALWYVMMLYCSIFISFFTEIFSLFLN